MTNHDLPLPLPEEVQDREGGHCRYDRWEPRQQRPLAPPQLPNTIPPPRPHIQDPVSIIPKVVTEASGVENENNSEAALDLINGLGHEATADPGEGLQSSDQGEVAVRGQPHAGGTDEGVRQPEGRPIR